MSKNVITSYKGFDKDMKCRDFQYEVGKEYNMDGEIKCCNRGFHACKSPFEVWDYYDMLNSRFAEVEQTGKIDEEADALTTGNASHKKALIKGMAARSAEFVEKYSVDIADSASDLK